MTSLFREQTSAGVFWLIAVSIIVHAHFFITPPVVLLSSEAEILSNIMAPLQSLPQAAITFIYYLFVIIQALRLNYLLNDLKMLPRQAFVTAVSYVLLTALFPAWNNMTPALVMNTFLIWLIYRLSKLPNTSNPKTVIYNIGLITGITIMLYNPAVTLALFVFWALGILRPFHANEWFILLLGLITPFYFLGGILFLQDHLQNFPNYLPHFHWHLPAATHQITITITSIAVCVMVFTGIIVWQANNGRMVIQAKKNWAVLILMFLFLVPAAFILKNTGFNCLLLCIVPAAALAGNTFYYPRGFFPNLLFWALIAVTALNNWYYINR